MLAVFGCKGLRVKCKAALDFDSFTLSSFQEYWEIGAIKLLGLRIKAGGSRKLVGGIWKSYRHFCVTFKEREGKKEIGKRKFPFFPSCRH